MKYVKSSFIMNVKSTNNEPFLGAHISIRCPTHQIISTIICFCRPEFQNESFFPMVRPLTSTLGLPPFQDFNYDLCGCANYYRGIRSLEVYTEWNQPQNKFSDSRHINMLVGRLWAKKLCKNISWYRLIVNFIPKKWYWVKCNILYCWRNVTGNILGVSDISSNVGISKTKRCTILVK